MTNRGPDQRADSRTETATGLEHRLGALLRQAIELWQVYEDLPWAEVVERLQRQSGVARLDEPVRLLLSRIGAPGTWQELSEIAERAIGETIQRLLTRAPSTTRRPPEKETERPEPPGEADTEPQNDIVFSAANKRVAHDLVRSIRAPHDQPLSGTTQGAKLVAAGGLVVTGFADVSPPEQLPIEYTALDQRHTGMAAADRTTSRHMDRTLTFAIPALARASRKGDADELLVNQVSVELTLKFDRQVYYVLDAPHVDIRQAELPTPRRFANVTIEVTNHRMLVAGDQVNLDLTLHMHRDDIGAMVYSIHWTLFGHLAKSRKKTKTIEASGTIKITQLGRLIAMDKTTARFFDLTQ